MAATFQVSAPEPFTFSCPEEWPKWSRRFERFRIASGLVDKEESAQVNTLIYSVGDEADDILRSFTLSSEDSKKYATVKGKFDSHFVKRRNVIFERAKFNMRRQQDGEPVDAFIMALYGLAKNCGYGDLHNEMIRDLIVVGIRDVALSEKLQLKADLTLDEAVTQVRQSEAVKLQQPLLRNRSEGKADTPVGAVNRGRTWHRPKPENKSRQNTRATPAIQSGGSTACTRCGKRPAHDHQHCSAKDVTCRKCGKRGHYQAVCRSARVSQVDTHADYSDVFLGAMGDTTNSPWSVTIDVNETPIELHIDNGAEVTVISEEAWRKVGQPVLSPPDRTLRGPDTHKLPTTGRFTAKLSKDESIAEEQIYVVKGLHKPLLGRPAIDKLRLVSRISAVDQTDQDQTPADKLPKLFEGLSRLQGEYWIELQERAEPYALSTPRRVAIPLMKSVEQELQRMEDLGVIAKVHEPTEWCAGMVVVPKANGKVRICIDLTNLNQSVRRHPLPAVDQTLAQLAGAKVFSKLDGNSGFWQIPLAPESAKLTTFITPFGRYCFHRLPFGIMSAPEHFQHRMSEILSGIPGVVCIMDDILVHGKTQQEHDQRLHEVLERMQAAGATLNAEKCQFSKESVKFLGHVVDPTGIRPDPDKVTAIRRVRTPANVGDGRRFLGMVNQMSKFSPNLAEETQSLRELLMGVG